MGQTTSSHECFTKEDVVDWENYIVGSWRSHRSVELDSLGGLGRRPVLLGSSFNAKMMHLGEQLALQGDRLQEIIAPPKSAQDTQSGNKKPAPNSFHLNTDRRAAERRGVELPANNPDAWQSAPKGSYIANAEYIKQKKINELKGVLKKQQLNQATAGRAPLVPAAPWRRNIQRARRNAYITVTTMLRLKRGHDHPRRFPRFADLSFFIPQLLGEDMGRFISEQSQYGDVRRTIATARAELDELLRAAAAEVGPPTPSRGEGTRQGMLLPPVPGASGRDLQGDTSGELGSPIMPGLPPRHGSQPEIRVGSGGASVSMGGFQVEQDRSSAPVLLGGHRRATFDANPAGDPHSAQPGSLALRQMPSSTTQQQVQLRKQWGVPAAVSGGPQRSVSADRRRARTTVAAADGENIEAAHEDVVAPLRSPQLPKTSSWRRLATDAGGGDGERLSPSRPTFSSGQSRQVSMPRLRSPESGEEQDGTGATAVIGAPGTSYSGTCAQQHAGRQISMPAGRKPAARQGLPGIRTAQGAAVGQGGQQGQGGKGGTEVDKKGRMVQLRDDMDTQFAALKQCQKMLGMYVNRVNGAWAEAQAWGAPEAATCNELAAWSKGDQYLVYKADVIRKLRQGQVAVQVMAGDDAITVPVRAPGAVRAATTATHQQDLWTADLWEVVDLCRPGIMPATDRIEGLSMGGRVLCQLALAVAALAGKEAAGRLTVILHVNDDQEEEVCQELHKHQFYGLNRENVILVVSQRSGGYRFDAATCAFVPETTAEAALAGGSAFVGQSVAAQPPGLMSLGSGHALCQLAWAGAAFTVGEDGLHVPLDLPVLDTLGAKKAEWLISRRARDMGLLSGDGIIDAVGLAYCLFLRDRARVTGVVEAVRTTSAVVARQHDSILMHRQSEAQGQSGDHRKVSELRQNEVVTPKVIDAVEAARTGHGGRGLAVGLGRYCLHVPTIKAALTSLSIFRPRVSLSRELLHLNLDLADLLAHGRSRTYAIEARHAPGLLCAPSSLDALIPLLQAQDHDPGFRDQVLSLGMAAQEAGPRAGGDHVSFGPTVVAGNRAGQKPGQPYVVFVVNNQVSTTAVSTAASLARGGRDALEIVTFVPTEGKRGEGEELLGNLKRVGMRSMADVKTTCVVRGPLGLLDSMERFVEAVEEAHGVSPVVVMGSVQLTSNVFNYVVGSITLSAIRRLSGTPVVVVTANSKQAPAKPGMRTLALVEGHARPMMTFLCTAVLDPGRGDRLLLGQVLSSRNITRQQAANYRRLLDNFHTLAFSHQTQVSKALVMDGAMDKVLCEAVEEHGVGLLAIQLPAGTKSLPQQLLSLLRSSRAATLIHQDSGVRQSMMRKSGALRRSVTMLAVLQQARAALAEGGE